jgi:hypothetical protein
MAGRDNLIEDGKYFREQLGKHRGFIVSYSTATDESSEAGEYEDIGYNDYHDCEPDELDAQDNLTAVDLAITYLKDKGAFEPTSTSFSVGTSYESDPDEDFQTGEHTHLTYHPENFTPAEEEAIFKGMTAK